LFLIDYFLILNMKPVMVYLPEEIVNSFKIMKKLKKIKSLSGEIRALVMKNYDPMFGSYSNHKPITEYFNAD